MKRFAESARLRVMVDAPRTGGFHVVLPAYRDRLALSGYPVELMYVSDLAHRMGIPRNTQKSTHINPIS